MPDLQQAITTIKSGDKITGKQLLIEVLKADQQNEAAWLWMTQVVSTDAERIKCLQNVLKINPGNEAAKKGLATIQQRQAPPKPIEPPPEYKLAVVPSTPPIEKPKGDTKPVKPLKPPKREDTKKCPYCAETIKAEAKFCRFCGKDLRVEWQSIQRQQKRKSDVPFLLGLILFGCIGLGLVITFLNVLLPSNPNPAQSNPNTSKPERSTIEARTMCADFVEKRLKSPSTANFLLDTEIVSRINGKPDNWYAVRGQVDAQNSFGATIRSDYYCQLYHDVNDPDTWHLHFIEVE